MLEQVRALWPLIVDVDYAKDLATWSAEIYVFATRMREAANTRGAQFFLNCRYVTRPKLYPRPAKSMRIIDCLALYVFGCQVRKFNAEALWSGKETSKTGYEKPKFSSFVSHPIGVIILLGNSLTVLSFKDVVTSTIFAVRFSACRTRRVGATRRRVRFDPLARDRAIGTCPRAHPVRAHTWNTCDRGRRPRARTRSCLVSRAHKWP